MNYRTNQTVKQLKTGVHLTPSGKALVLSMSFILLSSAIIPAFGVFACLLAVLVCSWIFGVLFKPRISIRTELPDQATVGSDITIRYHVKNLSSSHSFCLTLNLSNLPNSWKCHHDNITIAHLKPASMSVVEIILTPTRRGRFVLPCPACFSSFPFHLFSFNVAKGTDSHMTVLPEYDLIHISQLSSMVTGRHEGSRMSSYQSHMSEYAGNRPFITGDSLRYIDSRAWARLAEPVVKEYHNTTNHTCVLWLMDLRRAKPTPAMWDPDLEAMISFCASVAYSVQLSGRTMIDSLVIGEHILHLHKSLSQFNQVLESLADISVIETVTDATRILDFVKPEGSIYLFYLGDPEPCVELCERLGIPLNQLLTIRISQTPSGFKSTWFDYDCHRDIDTNLVLSRQITTL